MWQTDFTADTELDHEAVWRALRALQTGQVPLTSGDTRRLNGPFAVGGTIAVTPVGLSTLESTITELSEGCLLAEQTRFGDLTLLLTHTVHPLGDGGTRIIRRLRIDGAKADTEGPVAGPRISDDYPQALQEIIALARVGRPVASGPRFRPAASGG